MIFFYIFYFTRNNELLKITDLGLFSKLSRRDKYSILFELNVAFLGVIDTIYRAASQTIENLY